MWNWIYRKFNLIRGTIARDAIRELSKQLDELYAKYHELEAKLGDK